MCEGENQSKSTGHARAAAITATKTAVRSKAISPEITSAAMNIANTSSHRRRLCQTLCPHEPVRKNAVSFRPRPAADGRPIKVDALDHSFAEKKMRKDSVACSTYVCVPYPWTISYSAGKDSQVAATHGRKFRRQLRHRSPVKCMKLSVSNTD